jgi:ATP-dependent DNA helicase RecQ
MPLDEICNATGLEMSDLLDEIEAIVNSGTRINIDYYLDSILDEDVVEDIYLYFKEDAETDSLEEAMEELNDTGYSEEEVRLVRIKFISEMGN